MKRYLPIACLLLCAFQCGVDYDGPDVYFGPGESITRRDAQGRPNGPPDPDDWVSDATWSGEETHLLGLPYGAGLVPLNGSQQLATVSHTEAFPNPAPNGEATWRIQLSLAAPCPCLVQSVYVSRRYTFIDRSSDTLQAGDSRRVPLRTQAPGQLYRLYYLISNANGLLYKGHGDVRHAE
ncbi:hypothetical protein [Hymenobacter psoromatis]|uniref:hypothetical protein n=1 Tax=Hymenobacter psoromatis TaxID=1484116 RepID=UPI001CBF0F12|nr:hypothetical protein [Hymenobacter psoromatis]